MCMLRFNQLCFKNKGSGATKSEPSHDATCYKYHLKDGAKACRCKSAMHTKTGDWRNLFSTSCQCSKKFALVPAEKGHGKEWYNQISQCSKRNSKGDQFSMAALTRCILQHVLLQTLRGFESALSHSCAAFQNTRKSCNLWRSSSMHWFAGLKCAFASSDKLKVFNGWCQTILCKI